MTRRNGMVVDTRRCVGCNACVIACKAENALPSGGFRNWVADETRGELPTLHLEVRSERCNHCSEAACLQACPSGATYRGAGGEVLVDPAECTGCKVCIAACPYGARYVHPAGYVDKCTFCAHRTARDLVPACADNCPTGALTFGDLSDPRSEVVRLLKARRFRVLAPESGTEPNVFYLT